MDAARHQFLLSIPDQLCVVGFDDIEQASCSFYDLTTFAQPVVAIARQAVTWLGEPVIGQARRPFRNIARRIGVGKLG